KKKIRHYVKDQDGSPIHEFLIDSKTGAHSKTRNPHFPDDLSPKAEHIQHILEGIASQIGGDGVQDLSRCLRLPGTMNRKDERNVWAPVLCAVAECDKTRRYPLHEFERLAQLSPDKARAEEVAKVQLPPPRKLTPGRRHELTDHINTCAVAQDRSRADYALCCWAIRKGLDPPRLSGQVPP